MCKGSDPLHILFLPIYNYDTRAYQSESDQIFYFQYLFSQEKPGQRHPENGDGEGIDCDFANRIIFHQDGPDAESGG